MKRLSALLLLALSLGAWGQAKRQTFKPSDGHWWLNASSDEQDGFMIGYDECSSFVLRRQGPDASRYEIEDAVTGVYNEGSEGVPVAAVIKSLFERWRKEHRYHFVRADPSNEYDGDIWWQSSYAGRGGIIRGFEACQHAEAGEHSSSSVSVASLIDRVSWWYGMDPIKNEDTDQAREAKHGGDKLGAVILWAEKESQRRRSDP